MGIFTDLALGGITQFGEVAERDTQANVTIANNSLAKENKALEKFSNKPIIINSKNVELFGLTLSPEEIYCQDL